VLAAQDKGLRRVAAQPMEFQVKGELAEARKSRDPGTSKLLLKALQDQVRRASELDSAGRARLKAQVGSAIQSAARAEVTQREIQARSEAVQSSQSSIKRLIIESEHQTVTEQQLVERYCQLRIGDCPDAIPMSKTQDHSWFAYLHVTDTASLYDDLAVHLDHKRRVG